MRNNATATLSASEFCSACNPSSPFLLASISEDILSSLPRCRNEQRPSSTVSDVLHTVHFSTVGEGRFGPLRSPAQADLGTYGGNCHRLLAQRAGRRPSDADCSRKEKERNGKIDRNDRLSSMVEKACRHPEKQSPESLGLSGQEGATRHFFFPYDDTTRQKFNSRRNVPSGRTPAEWTRCREHPDRSGGTRSFATGLPRYGHPGGARRASL